MNYITNDRNEEVPAKGAPGSEARARCRWPALIDGLNNLYFESCDSYGRALDEAIDRIRAAGVTNYAETDTILACTHYRPTKI